MSASEPNSAAGFMALIAIPGRFRKFTIAHQKVGPPSARTIILSNFNQATWLSPKSKLGPSGIRPFRWETDGHSNHH
jgi:hypothetical protein